MKISFSVLVYDGLSYSKENPGIAIVDYADFLGWKEDRTDAFWDEVRTHFAKQSHLEFYYTVERTTTIGEITHEIISRTGFNGEAVLNAATQIYILAEKDFVQIQNSDIRIGDIEKYYELRDYLQIFFVLSNQAGTLWNDDGLRYYINSKEDSSHHIPHVHVDYKHKYSASVSLVNSEVLVGNLPPKILKKVEKKINDNRDCLLKYWEEHTDGLRVDINCSFGITGLKV